MEVADLLKMTDEGVRNLVQLGKLEPLEVDPWLRFSSDAVARYRARVREESEAGPLRVVDAAAYLGVDKNKVRYLIRKGVLQVDPTRTSRVLRVTRESLDRYLNKGKIADPPEMKDTQKEILPASIKLRDAQMVTGLSVWYLQQGVESGEIRVVQQSPLLLETESLLAYAREHPKADQRVQDAEPAPLPAPHIMLVSFTLHYAGRLTRPALEEKLAGVFEGKADVELISVGNAEDARRHPRATILIRSTEPIPARTIQRSLKYKAGTWVTDVRVEWTPEKREEKKK